MTIAGKKGLTSRKRQNCKQKGSFKKKTETLKFR